MTTTDEATGPVSLPELIEFMRDKAIREGDNPEPLMRGTFAMYATPDGGVMMVASVPDGPMTGTHHHRINPSMIRAAAAFFGGGGPIGAIKGFFSGR